MRSVISDIKVLHQFSFVVHVEKRQEGLVLIATTFRNMSEAQSTNVGPICTQIKLSELIQFTQIAYSAVMLPGIELIFVPGLQFA